ncbi:TNF receptor-associated factor 2-like isoform X2 [Glandiceps talaboti]
MKNWRLQHVTTFFPSTQSFSVCSNASSNPMHLCVSYWYLIAIRITMPGYRKELFLTAPEFKFLCTLCHLILKDPVQTYCGHRYCRSCIDEILSQPGHHVCVECGEEYGDEPESLITTSQVFPDKAIQRELRLIKVRCINDGCDWEGAFKDYEDHIIICDYEVIMCIKRGCDQRILRGNLVNHLDTQCVMRVVQCEYCDEDITWKELKEHHKKCPKFLITCRFCGKNNIPRYEFAAHIDVKKGDCKKKVAPCNYEKLGCEEMVEVEKMSVHLQGAVVYHMDLLRYEISKVSDSMNELCKLNVRGMSGEVVEQSARIDGLEKLVKELENKIAKAIAQQHNPESGKLGPKALDPTIEKQTRNLQELKNKITIVETKVTTYEGIVAVLNSQIERDANVVQILERQRRQDRELLESLERKIKAQDRIIALKDVALAEQDLRIQSLEMASYDGVLVWKISNFNQKRQDALSGRTTSIYSPCFYTSRHGYKMCSRIYINGDGMGKGNHVSLFFVIMKGPFDALLRWPFRQKVTFMLLDQNNREHVIDAFRPDPTSSSFKRPTNDMNIASGCPLFMPISQLDSSRHAYVKDDVMFLKVIVDTSDIS